MQVAIWSTAEGPDGKEKVPALEHRKSANGRLLGGSLEPDKCLPLPGVGGGGMEVAIQNQQYEISIKKYLNEKKTRPKSEQIPKG